MLSVLACTTDLAWIVSALSQTVNSSQFCQPCFLQNFLILLVLFCVTYPILCQQFLLLPALVFCNSSWFSQSCLVQQILDFVSPVSVNSPSFSSVLQQFLLLSVGSLSTILAFLAFCFVATDLDFCQLCLLHRACSLYLN